MITVNFEPTPNPQSMRFSASQPISTETFEFNDAKQTLTSPLARKLFGFPWTQSVYVGRDFVTVTKQDWVDWNDLADPLCQLIQEHLESGQPAVILPTKTQSSETEKSDSSLANSPKIDSNESDVVKRIREILDQEIRPAVALDGGDIAFNRYENNIVYIHMQGSCAGCPSSTMTLKMGIEARLKNAIPEIVEVVSI